MYHTCTNNEINYVSIFCLTFLLDKREKNKSNKLCKYILFNFFIRQTREK